MSIKLKLFAGIVMLLIGVFIVIVTFNQIKINYKPILSSLIICGIFIIIGIMLIGSYFIEKRQ